MASSNARSTVGPRPVNALMKTLVSSSTGPCGTASPNFGKAARVRRAGLAVWPDKGRS
jgi:hypothetical protein